MNKHRQLKVEAKLEKLPEVLAFVNQSLEELGCTVTAQMQIEIAVEEVFVNVVTYAYENGNEKSGIAEIHVAECEDPRSVSVAISDTGIPFDPLAKEDPDVTLSAEKREIGGLGIFMVKQSMDHVQYEYKEGRNILTFRKDLS